MQKKAKQQEEFAQRRTVRHVAHPIETALLSQQISTPKNDFYQQTREIALMYLSSCLGGRENNLNLLRLMAATAVLVSHSFPIATGDKSSEPLRAWLGYTPGSIAVDIFFFISGLLITQSAHRTASVTKFLRARALRIFPGLWVSLMLTVLVVGGVATQLPVNEYFGAGQTWRYLLLNSSALYTEYFLPGVYEKNPFGTTVNGSLWTLKVEVRCYFMVIALWWVTKSHESLFRIFTIAIAFALMAYIYSEAAVRALEDVPYRLYGLFFLGGAAYHLARWMPISGVLALSSFILVCALAAFGLKIYYLYFFALPIVVVWFGYAEIAAAKLFHVDQDISYGVYIYAFPVQQFLAHSIPGVGPYSLMALSLVAVYFISWFSWRMVESPALRWR